MLTGITRTILPIFYHTIYYITKLILPRRTDSLGVLRGVERSKEPAYEVAREGTATVTEKRRLVTMATRRDESPTGVDAGLPGRADEQTGANPPLD